MLQEVLDVARLQGGRLTLTVSPFDVRRWLAEAVESHAAAAAARRIRVSVVCSRAVPARLLGDPGRLQHVLRSFLSDSIDVTAEGSEVIVHCALEQPQRSVADARRPGTIAGVSGVALTSTTAPVASNSTLALPHGLDPAHGTAPFELMRQQLPALCSLHAPHTDGGAAGVTRSAVQPPAASPAAADLPVPATSLRADGHSSQPASTRSREQRGADSPHSPFSGAASPGRKQTLPAAVLPLASAASAAEAPTGTLLDIEPIPSLRANAVSSGEPRREHSDADSSLSSPASHSAGSSMFSFPPSTEYTSRIIGRPSRIVPDRSASTSLVAHEPVRQSPLLLRVSVQRRGALLSSEQLRTAFDAYVHVPVGSGTGQNSDAADVESGLSNEGFGLLYAREVVQLCGGSVGASNVVGLGTALWFQVPLLPAPPADDFSAAASDRDAVSTLFSSAARVSHAKTSDVTSSLRSAPASARGRRVVSDSSTGGGITITTSDQTAERVRRHSPPPMQSAFDTAVALHQHAAGSARRLSSTSASRLPILHAPPVAAASAGVRRSSLKAVDADASPAHHQSTPRVTLGDSATPTAVAVAMSARDAASAPPA